MPTYPHAPIVEAILELRFASPISRALTTKAAKHAKSFYTYSDPDRHVNLNVDVEKRTVGENSSVVGTRLNSLERTELTIFRTNSFVCARLAPYTRWEELRERALRDWGILRRAVAAIRVARVGMRYINRLDVPMIGRNSVDHGDYLNVRPAMPASSLTGSVSNYFVNVVRPLNHDQCVMTLNSCPVVSPIPGHSSFLLDIDISREMEIPQDDVNLWSLLDSMRLMRNDIFEMCVTDKARALFA